MSLLQPDQPLYLPKGSIRAILALLVIGVVAFVIFTSNIKLTGEQVMTLATLILGFYFISKQSGPTNPAS